MQVFVDLCLMHYLRCALKTFDLSGEMRAFGCRSSSCDFNNESEVTGFLDQHLSLLTKACYKDGSRTDCHQALARFSVPSENIAQSHLHVVNLTDRHGELELSNTSITGANTYFRALNDFIECLDKEAKKAKTMRPMTMEERSKERENYFDEERIRRQGNSTGADVTIVMGSIPSLLLALVVILLIGDDHGEDILEGAAEHSTREELSDTVGSVTEQFEEVFLFPFFPSHIAEYYFYKCSEIFALHYKVSITAL
ncbi:unnamed protein product [Toxocara canis]|uniref:Interleukin-6 n=1 Tax=Toxocara canis TaxID=6265 RepID=A0A183V8M5_TOXCA|nr:unnamed protein product [Toxocara canis]